jgi:hypothetical protein
MLIHINDRSDLEQQVSYNPKNRQFRTLRQELEASSYHRNDIVLVNCTRTGRQYTLHVTGTGYAGDLFVLDFLNDEQHAQVEGIAARMRQNAVDFPPAVALLWA